MKRLLVVALSGLAVALAGCKGTAPVGNSGGRLDPYSDTGDPAGLANVVDMRELADTFVEGLVDEIRMIPAINESKTRKVLEVGTFANHTSTASRDFEQLMSMVRSRISSSRYLRDRLMIVTSRSRTAANLDKIQGAAPPDLQEGTPPEQPRRYNSEDTYVLGGTFSQITRGNVFNYFFEVELSNLASREIVFQRTIEPRRR